MLDDEFKKSAIEKLKSMDSNEMKKVFKEIGSKPETNEEWFDALPTEEKAEFMGDIWGRGYLTSHFEGNLKFGKKQDKAYWQVWLKQPHREER